MLDDYSQLLRVCLAFLALSPRERQQLLPDAWVRPVLIDNGYAFHAEQPRHVMADFCRDWLRLQEFWEEIPAYTGLALEPESVQAQAEEQLRQLRERASELHWRKWADSKADCAVASALLQLLSWPAELSQADLSEELDTHTYGTFSAALHQPEKWYE